MITNKFGIDETPETEYFVIDAANEHTVGMDGADLRSLVRSFFDGRRDGDTKSRKYDTGALNNIHHKTMYASVTKIMGAS